jgi:hypothetical protein
LVKQRSERWGTWSCQRQNIRRIRKGVAERAYNYDYTWNLCEGNTENERKATLRLVAV